MQTQKPGGLTPHSSPLTPHSSPLTPHSSPLTPHPTLFISDLHLTPERPETVDAFLRFMTGPARQAKALYILGDFFEHWVGDELKDPFNRAMADALADLAQSGVPIYLMGGNRDFLLGKRFARAAQVTLLQDPTLLNLAGRPTLLMHGDSLCTDDHAYQAFRRRTRSPLVQGLFACLPLSARRAIFKSGRKKSEAYKQIASTAIMDVNAEAVAQVLRAHNYPIFIHGHTHRPARHELSVDGHTCERWVLPDWHDQAKWLECQNGECRFMAE